jgi:hypothetical protein
MSADAATVRRAFEVWNESGPAAAIDRFWAEDAVYGMTTAAKFVWTLIAVMLVLSLFGALATMLITPG